MENTSVPASVFSWIFRILLIAFSIWAIYWVYTKLYGESTDSAVLMKDIYVANPSRAYTFDKGKIPPVYEGGQYSISAWIYVNDLSANQRRGRNKEILKFGDFSTTSGTLVAGLYLDANDNTMHVLVSRAATNASATPADGKITTGQYDGIFSAASAASGNISGASDCKVSPVGFQRWTHVVVVLDGKTCDVYMDGKLARSCILPSVFRATQADGSIKVGENNGFGGYVSGIQALGYAMNPEQVYRTYQAGPLGAVSIWEYIKSFFDPKSIGTLDYPKMN